MYEEFEKRVITLEPGLTKMTSCKSTLLMDYVEFETQHFTIRPSDDSRPTHPNFISWKGKDFLDIYLREYKVS
mgnify:CR=1 FL=1